MIREYAEKYKIQIICVLCGFGLFALLSVVNPGGAKNIEFIARAGYGSDMTAELYVEGLEEETVLAEIPIAARKYSDDEIDAAMENCLTDALAQALDENTSFDEIYYDLDLPDYMSDYGFTLEWVPENREVVLSNGDVKNEELTEPVSTQFRLNISDGERSKNYAIPVTIMPQKLTESEQRMNGLLDAVGKADAEAATSDKVVLPTEYEGSSISYKDTTETNYNIVWILGIVIAVLLLLRDKENEKKEQEKRIRQMELDYPEIVSKLMVFVGAGLSVRMAWDSIARDYENAWVKIEGTPERRYAYEELCKANARLKTGVPEGTVYRDFGRACCSKQYMKLASLLEQNRRSGLANMKTLLQVEMVEAWEERKNVALRQGEEASTKLMLPLFMMLAVVMIIIMVPAMMSF